MERKNNGEMEEEEFVFLNLWIHLIDPPIIFFFWLCDWCRFKFHFLSPFLEWLLCLCHHLLAEAHSSGSPADVASLHLLVLSSTAGLLSH